MRDIGDDAQKLPGILSRHPNCTQKTARPIPGRLPPPEKSYLKIRKITFFGNRTPKILDTSVSYGILRWEGGDVGNGRKLRIKPLFSLFLAPHAPPALLGGARHECICGILPWHATLGHQ